MTMTSQYLEVASLGIVGARDLVTLQTIDISSLTTHPVPLVPARFVAVTGKGPIDSNGSGKSSFLAACSLLLGDVQWALHVDGKQARTLLFNPESAGLDSTLGYRAADLGFIAGVFASADGNSEKDCITVWLRLSAQPQFIRARWTTGVMLADTGDDDQNSQLAAGLWNQLPAENEIGPKLLVQTLYGDSPRCMAYLDANIRKSSTQSLLNQALPSYSPETIANGLIALTGRDVLLDTEAEQRARLDSAKTDLSGAQTDHENANAQETRALAGVAHREQARTMLADGDRLWQLHFAAGVVETAAEAAALDETIASRQHDVEQREQDLAEAKDALARLQDVAALQAAGQAARRVFDDLSNRDRGLEQTAMSRRLNADRLQNEINALGQLANVSDGRPLEQTKQATADAQQAVHDARLAVGDANRGLTLAQDALTAAREGLGGDARPSLQALRAAGIDAVALLDTIQLAQTDRPGWEPRLWPYRHAAVIDPADQTAALLALANLPGATVIVADGPLLPPTEPGPVQADVPLNTFLTVLEQRTSLHPSPDRAEDSALAHVVLGGFETILTGRDARIAVLERHVLTAQTAQQGAAQTQERAELLLAHAKEQQDAAQAVLDLTALRAQKKTEDEALTAAEEQRAALQPQLKDADRTLRDIDSDLRANTALAAAARGRVHAVDNMLNIARELRNAARTQRAAVTVDYWIQAWGDTIDTARDALAAEGANATRKRHTWRNKANLALNDAVNYYRHSVDMLSADLERALEARDRAGEDEQAVDKADYTTVATPLRDLLDETLEHDVRLAADIAREQARRTRVIAEADAEVVSVERDLATLQQSILGRVQRSLERISDAFNRLDLSRPEGYGAHLVIDGKPPADSAGMWRWSVVPEWKRSPSSKYVRYSVPANSAQVKIAAIQLVLAALLTGDQRSGRVLILDELGDSLGEVNRREILAAIDRVARENGVTILGTCQDDVREAAAPVCGQMIWFSHPSANSAFNNPTRTWGFDPVHGLAIELTAPALRAGREF